MSLKPMRRIAGIVVMAAALAVPVAASSADSADRAKRAAKVIRVADDVFAPNSARVGRGRVIT